MNKVLFGLAFILGALAVIGMSGVFLGKDSLALEITLVIGLVYAIGTIELLRFQKATQSLTGALLTIPDFQTDDSEGQFPNWLAGLHPSLRNAVQLRIEGERIGLPSPIVTPYLVGLLVMLGLLGTFVGMVDTLQGAVLALQGTTELEAIRAGLAAPINGLGLAFGTSVAGVAASAMLGLMSTLSRRERIVATRDLDACISHEFKGFSLVHNRQETYKALQAQAQALPMVAEQLQVMADRLEQMGGRLGEQLNDKQERFHDNVKENYQGLADSVAQSLTRSLDAVQKGLSDSGRLAGESIRPIFEDSMNTLVLKVTQNTEQSSERFSALAKNHLESLDERFSDTATTVKQVWQEALGEQDRANQNLSGSLKETLSAYSADFEAKTKAMLDAFDQSQRQAHDETQKQDGIRREHWQQAMTSLHEENAQALKQSSASVAEELEKVSSAQQASLAKSGDSFTEMTTTLATMSKSISSDWQSRADQVLLRQQELTDHLSSTQLSLDEQTRAHSAKVLSEFERLFSASDSLLAARQQSESTWLAEVSERMMALTEGVRAELSSLRNDEAGRAEAATGHMLTLQTSLATQIADLGQALEQPMTRLIETASETPKAAAEVISQLRQEISNNMERDNSLLEERQRIMAELDGLSDSLSQSSNQQREAIAKLVETSSGMLEKISSRFDQHIDAEVEKLSEIVIEAAASTTDIASLGDAFSHACSLFSASNERLGESLVRIESSLEQSSERSNEQLSYYVAQAREVIDHSVMSQKALFEELRELSLKQSYDLQSTASAQG